MVRPRELAGIASVLDKLGGRVVRERWLEHGGGVSLLSPCLVGRGAVPEGLQATIGGQGKRE